MFVTESVACVSFPTRLCLVLLLQSTDDDNVLTQNDSGMPVTLPGLGIAHKRYQIETIIDFPRFAM